MLVFLFVLIGAALTILPLVIPNIQFPLNYILCGMGILLLFIMAIAAVVTNLYRKASANMSFVRTGMGGAKVIKDGGCLVVPVMHQVIPVSLETMRLCVERSGPHALITKDNLRVDLSAEFYIKVQANSEDILQAARSLGGRSVNPDAVTDLLQEKLVSALRTVSATKELVELHAKRDEFASAVQAIVTHDLASNGLTLESVTISSLDQTDPAQLQERNVFDAQGLRKIAEITQTAMVQRNEIEREAEQSMVRKNVDTKKQVLELQRDQAEFEAEQKMKVANVQAGREREVQEYKLAQEEAIARRNIEKQKAIETTEVQKKLAVEQAEVDKGIALVAKFREQECAQIEKVKAVEVAERTKQVAIVQKEEERAAAQAKMLDAEAEREASSQKVLTVQVTAEAEREAQKKLIAAKQVIMENKIREETSADVLAYTEVKTAEGERQAADLQYEAKLRLAEGDSKAAMKKAEGEQAVKMVDVTVERERVGVEQARVDVERKNLSNKQEFEGAALQFEIEKLRIQAERDVRIQTANALANMLAKAEVKIFADPETMTRMSQQFLQAASYGIAADALLSNLPEDARRVLSELGSRLGALVGPKGGDGKRSGNGHATVETVATVVSEPAMDGASRVPPAEPPIEPPSRTKDGGGSKKK
jgi:flotillin